MRSGYIQRSGRILNLLAAPGLALALLALTGCASRPAATSTVYAPDDVAWKHLSEGTKFKAWFNDTMTVVLFEITGGDKRPTPPKHHHPHEQIGYVLEGRALVTLGDKTEEIVPGGVYTVTANVPHTVKPLTHRLVLLESFTPTREDFRRDAE